MTLIATIAAAATASWDPTFFGLCHRTAGLRCSRFLVNDVSLWIWTKRICLHTSLPFCVQYLWIHVCDGMNAYDYNMELPSAEYTNIVDHCPGFFLRSKRCVQRMWPAWILPTWAWHLTSVRHKRTTKADVMVRCAAWYDHDRIVPSTSSNRCTRDCTCNIS